ncbi:conserved protein, unknown function [Hepatocystis sp. ex Piliocolobus tephrosceles]|nr:conserved protein, unknown function [Hepatocystis sp. ex Piliocolobus tephrosceles]
MNGIRALFLFKYTDVGCNFIYKKYFFNVEMCAKSVQGKEYVNICRVANIENLIKNRIIKNENTNILTCENLIELNKIISCYSLKIKKKTVYPFLLIKKKNFYLIILLYIDDINSTHTVDVIKNNICKLLYYNFMNDFLNYVESNAIKYNYIFNRNNNEQLYVKKKLQDFTNKLDFYLLSVIPYGRVMGEHTNYFFRNYMEKNMYNQNGDILETNFFMFYNFLFFKSKELNTSNKSLKNINKNRFNNNDGGISGHSIWNQYIDVDESDTNDENSDEDRSKKCDNMGKTNKNGNARESNKSYKTNQLNKDNNTVNVELIKKNENEIFLEQKKYNNILYINSKPNFTVNENYSFVDGIKKHDFFKLLFKFLTLVKQNKYLTTSIPEKNYYYPLYLIFFYNYSILFETNKKIPIIKTYDQNEHIKISKENIQTYVPIYLHQKNEDIGPYLLIKEELTCFISSVERNNAEIKGEIILKCGNQEYLDVDMTVELDKECCDIYATHFANIKKRNNNLNIKFSCTHEISKIVTYYYKNMICPFVGTYNFKKINEKQSEICVTLKRNYKIPNIKIGKKSNDYFFLKLPFPTEVVNSNLKCDIGKIEFDNKKEIKWLLNDFTKEQAILSGLIEFSNMEQFPGQLAGYINIFCKSNYSKTKITHINKKVVPNYYFQSKQIKIISS